MNTVKKNKQKLIVHLIFSLESGGAENLMIDIINNQVKKARVSLIVINNRADDIQFTRIDKSVSIIKLKRKEGSKFNVYFLLRLWKYLLIESPSVIHCHNENLVSLLPFFRRRTVVTMHDVQLPKTRLNKYNKIFSVSKSVAEDLQTASIPSVIIPNGISFEDYNKRTSYDLLENDTFRIVQVSRLMHQKKGQDLLIHAVDILVNHYNIKNISLDLVGNGPSEEFLKKLVRELKVDKYITFHKNKDRNWIQRNLSEYHLLVQPSRYEGFGLTIIEGIAAGLPVIASDIQGPAEILNEVPSGLLFSNEDVNQLTSCIRNVLQMYKEGKVEFNCTEAFQFIHEKYSINKTADAYLDNYILQ